MPAPWGSVPRAWAWDGRVIHLIRPSLVQLVSMVLSDSPVFIVIGLARDEDDRTALLKAIVDPHDPFGDDDLDRIADKLVKGFFGIERWTAERLWLEAVQNWSTIDGDLLSRGVDVVVLDPARATSVIHRAVGKFHSENQAMFDRWQSSLVREPPRTAKVAAKDPKLQQTARDDWFALQAMAGGMNGA